MVQNCMKTFGRKVRAARNGLGLSLRHLARMTEIDYTYLSKLEADKSTPDERIVLALSDHLEVSADELFASLGQIAPDVRRIVSENHKKIPQIIRGISRCHPNDTKKLLIDLEQLVLSRQDN